MAAWDALPSVIIGTQTWDERALARITITMGRNSVEDQPRTGYCRVSILNHDNHPTTFEINDPGEITVLDSSGNPERVFTGYVSDINRSVVDHGPLGLVAVTDVTLVGPLARLSRRESESNYPKQLDGDRIADILADVFLTEWSEVDPALQWEDVDPSKTWLNYEMAYAGQIEQPGQYELVEYNGGPVEALSLADAAATSALGVLYECRNGLINYDSAQSRVDDVVANGFLQLSSDYMIGVGMATSVFAGQIINRMQITYKNGQVESGEDLSSQATYGLFASQKSTQLKNGSDAQQQIDFYMETRAYPRVTLDRVEIPLHNPNLPDALRDSLIKICNGDPVAIPDLPPQLGAGTLFEGFVENWSWQITRKEAFLTLGLSDYALTAIQEQWNQVDPSELWNTLSATLTWENARNVA